MIKAVIFDMDGVLVDNRDVHIEAFRILTRRYGVELDADNLTWMYGRGNNSIMNGILPPAVIERVGLEQLGREKERIYRDIYTDNVMSARGLHDFLASLHRSGIRCAVGSSAPRANVDFVLQRCRIEDEFEVVVSGDMVAKRKPDPDIFLLAAELMGLTSDECLVIEDSLAGIEAAQRAGMKTVAMVTTLPEEMLRQVHDSLMIRDFTQIDAEMVKKM